MFNLGYAVLSFGFIIYSIFSSQINQLIAFSEIEPVMVVLYVISSHMRMLLSSLTLLISALIVIYAFRNMDRIARYLNIRLK